MSSRSKNVKKMADLVQWEVVDELDKQRKDCGYSLRNILENPKYVELGDELLYMLHGREFNVAWCQETGFKVPVLCLKKDDLGLKVPQANFSIDQVRSYVGSRTLVEYVDSSTQKAASMPMKDWVKYWGKEPREELLNAMTLEISKTKFDKENLVVAPRLVRQIDWIDKAWPRHLKELQEDSTNQYEEMMYPKVQKFVLMSVANCYVDFHIDFGGTSVWYHTLWGYKVFWICPPTQHNIKVYEQWVKDGRPQEQFFGDMCDSCLRVDLPPGSTFFMPSGWIHAVFTVSDSLIFAGNFLHSFSIRDQLLLTYVEDSCRVPDKFKFPFFTEMLWYVLDRYTSCLMGKSNMDLPEEEKRRMRLEKGENIDPNKEFVNPGLVEEAPGVPEEHIHLTQEELFGLKYIVMYLHNKPKEEKDVPLLIPNPAQVMRDIKALMADHVDDCPEKAVTGKYVLRWTKDDNVETDAKCKKIIPNPKEFSEKLPENPFRKKYLRSMVANNEKGHKHTETPKKRRIRCLKCEGCKSEDCKTCVQCRDMPKYGGPGRMKQTCVKRRCARPGLPVAAACSLCGLDGWGGHPDPRKPVTEKPDSPPNLFECTICLDIIHPECAEKEGIGRGVVVPELANSWECRRCHGAGFGQEDRGVGEKDEDDPKEVTGSEDNEDSRKENDKSKQKVDKLEGKEGKETDTGGNADVGKDKEESVEEGDVEMKEQRKGEKRRGSEEGNEEEKKKKAGGQ